RRRGTGPQSRDFGSSFWLLGSRRLPSLSRPRGGVSSEEGWLSFWKRDQAAVHIGLLLRDRLARQQGSHGVGNETAVDLLAGVAIVEGSEVAKNAAGVDDAHRGHGRRPQGRRRAGAVVPEQGE